MAKASVLAKVVVIYTIIIGIVHIESYFCIENNRSHCLRMLKVSFLEQKFLIPLPKNSG